MSWKRLNSMSSKTQLYISLGECQPRSQHMHTYPTTYLFCDSLCSHAFHCNSGEVESLKAGIIDGCGSNIPACFIICHEVSEGCEVRQNATVTSTHRKIHAPLSHSNVHLPLIPAPSAKMCE